MQDVKEIEISAQDAPLREHVRDQGNPREGVRQEEEEEQRMSPHGMLQAAEEDVD